MDSTSGKFTRELFETVIIALILAFFIRTFVAESFLVFGNSMEPSIHNGERLLINKIVYRVRQPQPGEIIVFKYPKDPARDFIKRVIGIEGDTVEVRDGRVYRNGVELAEPYLLSQGFGDFPQETVPSGAVFVLGDNRNASEDSRYFGAVPWEFVRGRALLVYWPAKRLRILQ